MNAGRLRRTAFSAVAVTATAASVAGILLTHFFNAVIGLLAAFAISLAGAGILARWSERPLTRLSTWLGSPVETPMRVDSGPDWDTLGNNLAGVVRASNHRAALAETELERFRAVLATMADGVIVADGSAHVLLMNPAAVEMFGPAANPDGGTVIEATMNTTLDDAVRRVLANGGAETVDFDVVIPRSLRVRAAVSASGVGSADAAAVAVLHDLTENVRLDKIRRDFVANVSHELRTPVASIQMMTETLQAGALEDREAAKRFLNHIHDSAGRLVALVDDLLYLARAEAGGTPESVPVRVGSAARSVVAALHALASRKQLDIILEVPDDVAVLADPESLRQILGNLVENAVKYTADGGSVTVTAERMDDTVSISVVDTGIGIPREDLDRVFERFFRVDRARSRAVGGTGLGLSIVKHLAERLGGGVRVVSEAGTGSTFTVTLPSATIRRT